MLVLVDPHSGVPAYRQLVDQVRFQIASGILRPGDELPSTRTLSQELGLNPMTVSKAYSLLEQEGIVRRRPGLPLVVVDVAPAALERERLERLRAVLEPAALAARQLGLSTTRALAVFRELLAELSTPEDARR